jgi:hypothetical protein
MYCLRVNVYCHRVTIQLQLINIYHIKNTEALLVASKEVDLKVNAEITKYVVMSRDQNAGRTHNMKNENSSLNGWNSSNILEQP